MSVTDSLLSEYRAITRECGVVDRSERGKLALSGPDAKGFLQGQLTNDIEALAPGRGCYAAFLTPKGRMLGDVRVLDAGEELLLDTERLALQELFNTVRRFSIGFDVELHKRTLQCGLLSLIGPRSCALVSGAGWAEVSEHTHEVVEVDGVAARAIRTDVGVDLLCDAAVLDALRAAVLAAGAVPAGEAAAEIVRVERGRPRYGVDLDDTVIPQEAGLNARAVSFTKGCYVGQETVARLHYKGKPNRHLRGLRLSAPAQAGQELFGEDRVVGRISSAVVSPGLGPIALGFVRREVEIGATVRVGADGVGADVVELPFDLRKEAG